MKKPITIFTASMFNNNYLNTPLHKFCITSWDRLKNYFNSNGYVCKIKIYDYDDPEIIEFFNIIKTSYTNYLDFKPSRLANMFRIWIMSKYPYYLWLDTDIYVNEAPNCNNLKFDYDSKEFEGNWSVMYNSNDLKFFQNIWKLFLKEKSSLDNNLLGDYKVYNRIYNLPLDKVASQSKYRRDRNFIHLALIDDIQNKPNRILDKKSFYENKTIKVFKIKANKNSCINIKDNPLLINFLSTYLFDE